jgi:hypothetical protein
MLCPAVYPPDPTLGITDPQRLTVPQGRPAQSELPASAVSGVWQVLPPGSGPDPHPA